jgi:Na+(H+)/acetate symporter ActP
VWVVGYDSFHIILDGQLRRVHLYTAVDVVTRRLTASIVRFGDDREVPHEAA